MHFNKFLNKLKLSEGEFKNWIIKNLNAKYFKGKGDETVNFDKWLLNDLLLMLYW